MDLKPVAFMPWYLAEFVLVEPRYVWKQCLTTDLVSGDWLRWL